MLRFCTFWYLKTRVNSLVWTQYIKAITYHSSLWWPLIIPKVICDYKECGKILAYTLILSSSRLLWEKSDKHQQSIHTLWYLFILFALASSFAHSKATAFSFSFLLNPVPHKFAKSVCSLMHTITSSVNKDNFTSFFIIHITLISFSFINPVKLLDNILNRYGENGPP